MTLLKKPGTYRQDAKSAKKIKATLNILHQLPCQNGYFYAFDEKS